MSYLVKPPSRAYLKRDKLFNERLKTQLTEYWAKMGHDVKFTISYNEMLCVYEVRSEDLVNGLPKESLSVIAKSRLLL